MTTKKTKVFCKNCQYDDYIFRTCCPYEAVKDNYYGCNERISFNQWEQNKNNDCKYYKEKEKPKVYCKDCKWFKKKKNKGQTTGPILCEHPTNLVEQHCFDCKHLIHNGSPSFLNENNDCQHFSKKNLNFLYGDG